MPHIWSDGEEAQEDFYGSGGPGGDGSGGPGEETAAEAQEDFYGSSDCEPPREVLRAPPEDADGILQARRARQAATRSGHPLCRQGRSLCLGNDDTPLLRHTPATGHNGDVYCEACWRDFGETRENFQEIAVPIHRAIDDEGYELLRPGRDPARA